MFPRAVADQQPGETLTLTAQVNIIPATATCLSYNLSGTELKACHLSPGVSISIHVGGCIRPTFWFGVEKKKERVRLMPSHQGLKSSTID